MSTGNPFIDMYLSDMDPAQQVQVRRSLQQQAAGRDNAPSARGATQAMPLSHLDIVNSKFDVSRIPLSRLAQMRRDAVIAFAMFFITAQMTRARWIIKSTDPKAAAFADNALRAIYSELVAAYCEKLAYGYQATVKRFGLALPDWTYIDPADPLGGQKPVWNNSGIKAVVFKPFVPINPMAADPLWTDDGSFNGIKYTPNNIKNMGLLGSGDTESVEFDVTQSLWFTNELASVHGSLWGYPRSGYVYRFWWSFWFNWGLADRHFEKDADPPIVVRYPANRPLINGFTTQQYALQMGDRARSNSTIAIPNDMIEGLDGKMTTSPEWAVEYLKGGGNFDVFKERFDQVSMLMFRGMMVPPDTFSAKGGTAGYNATSNLIDAFTLSQIVLMADLDFTINEYVLPQLMAANGFTAKVTKVTKGFDSTDMNLTTSILESAANGGNPEIFGRVDWEELLDIAGIPRLDAGEIARQAAQVQVPGVEKTVPDTSGNAGVNEHGLYYAAREVINLGEIDVAQFSDPVIADDSRRLRSVWLDSIGLDYNDAAMLLQDYNGHKILLDESFFERWWRRATNRAQQTSAQTRRVLGSIMRRASTVELEKAGLRNFEWDPAIDDEATRYLAERGAELVTGIQETTRGDIKTYLADLQRRKVDPEHMPDLVRTHFSMFAGHRADTLIRSEVGKAYNMATLWAAQDSGLRRVQAIDAQLGEARSDPTCIKRNGKIFSITDAFEETKKEHPNGTLQWKVLLD